MSPVADTAQGTAATVSSLSPAHQEDLRRSGLSEATITAAELYSVDAPELSGLVGRPIPQGTTGLVFRYHGCEGFSRAKVVPPLVDADGKPIRYLQRGGTGCRLYVPPSVAPVLADVTKPLAFVEGEKKSLAVCQAGWPAVGIGGIWNFTTDGELIPDIKAIPLQGRILRIVPDGETWEREDLLLAVFRFARLLEAEGATVFIVKLPILGGEKTGADDFIVAKGPTAFRRLVEEAVNLEDPAFKPFREQEKAKAREAQAHGDVRAEVDNIRLTPREVMAAFQKRRAIADLITEDLRERGRLLWTPDGPLFFTTATRTLSHLVEPPIELAALLARYGLNPSESEYAYVTHHLRVEAHTRGTRCEAHRLAYYDTRAGVLYVSCFDGSVYRLDGAALVRGDNGEDGVYFRDDPGWTPWEPDLSSSHDGPGVSNCRTVQREANVK